MIDKRINYIVSGLERSGTSVMMQLLAGGGVPVAFDDSRPADEHNPRGYYELYSGKIINQLMEGNFDFTPYKGKVIKITAYGLKFLPSGKYKIVFMLRNIDEVVNSMQKMGAEINKEKDRILFTKLNKYSFDLMNTRTDVEYITINYSDIIKDPRSVIDAVGRFLTIRLDADTAMKAVDTKLYRNRAIQ